MRLSELMSLRTLDSEGVPLDHVKDVRLEQRDGEWVVTHLVVGRAAVAERLGFIHGVVDRPVLLAHVLRRIARRARVVPWELVSFGGDGTVHVSAERDDLDSPEGSE